MDLGTFSLGALAGVAGGEAAKQLFSAFVKRRGERRENRRKSLRDDLAGASARVDTTVEQALKYFTAKNDEKRADLSRDVRHSIRTLGMQFNQLNVGLRSLDLPDLPGQLLIDFRRSCTMGLDAKDKPTLDPCDPEIVKVYEAAQSLRLAMGRIKYDQAA